jgi:hypothetical protein
MKAMAINIHIIMVVQHLIINKNNIEARIAATNDPNSIGHPLVRSNAQDVNIFELK